MAIYREKFDVNPSQKESLRPWEFGKSIPRWDDFTEPKWICQEPRGNQILECDVSADGSRSNMMLSIGFEINGNCAQDD